MTAVLLDSVKVGITGWFSSRRGNGLKVLGMEDGDRLLVACQPGEEELSVEEDGLLRLPSGVQYVQVQHMMVAERKNGGVCVDLIRKKSWAS